MTVCCSFTLRARGTAPSFTGTRVCVLPAIKYLLNCYTELLEWSKAAFMLLTTWPTVFSGFIISLLQYHCYFTLYFFHNPETVYVIYCMWFPPICLLFSFLFQRSEKHSKESARNVQLLSKKCITVHRNHSHRPAQSVWEGRAFKLYKAA